MGINKNTLLIPARLPGEADQPPQLFLRGLELVLEELASSGVNLKTIHGISVSAQQHAHVYLSEQGQENIARLNRDEANTLPLNAVMEDSFSYGVMPTWQTSVSENAAKLIRAHIGGSEKTIELSDSDSPARFTGAIIKNIKKIFPDIWNQTNRISLLSSFMSSILSGNPNCPPLTGEMARG